MGSTLQGQHEYNTRRITMQTVGRRIAMQTGKAAPQRGPVMRRWRGRRNVVGQIP